MDLTLRQAAEAGGGRIAGFESVALTGLCLDSRRVRPGDLFAALPGERVDGHRFVQAAADAGAAAALVSQRQDVDLPQLVVEDVAAAMAAIAGAWRAQLDVSLIGVTGSNGKTTVKEMLASILNEVGPTLATAGNYNNELGVPLTLSRLERQHRFAVVEMGCGQPGDIRTLARMAAPQVGVVTNAGPAHLERLGSIEGVARTKGELFECLPADGTAVINADDRFADEWRARAGHCRQISFGRSETADVRLAGATASGPDLVMLTPHGRIETRLQIPGEHNRLNALAAAAAALALEVSSEAIAAGLAAVHSLPGRLEPHRAAAGWTLIDDTYNANPASLYAGLRVITDYLEAGEGDQPSEPWLVLGDMAELGRDSARLHGEMGQSAADLGVRRLFTLGRDSESASLAFGRGAEHFTDQGGLVDALVGALHPGVVCLVKGSRSSAMERVVQSLLARAEPERESV